MKDKECYKCGQKGHIATVFPAKKINNDLDDYDKRKKSSSESSRIKNHSDNKKKEAEQFVQENDEEDEESDYHRFASFGFCTVNKRNKLQRQNMLLLDSCSTVDLFCNKNLVTKIWESKNYMTVKGNGCNLKTHKKEYVKNYGKVWFDGPAKKIKSDLYDDDNSKKSSSESSKIKNHSEKKKKEAEKLVQEDDEEDKESYNHGFTSFGFCNVNKGNKLQLKNMLLLYSCSTVDLFCNKNLVTKI